MNCDRRCDVALVECHPDSPRIPAVVALLGIAGRELPRKEVIQPHLPVRLPCYDFVPVARPTLGRWLHRAVVAPRTSGVPDSHDVTGGVYKARVRIHRALLTRGY